MKKVVLNLIRILISIGLLYYLIQLADVEKIIRSFENLNASPILLAGLAFILSMFFLSLRWLVLTRAYGMNAGFSQLFLYYFIGLFFNNFLPTSIGGDLSRAYYLSRKSGDRPAALGTILLERVIGLMATLSLAGLSLIWLLEQFSTLRIVYFTALLLFCVAFFLAFVMSRRMYKKLHKFLTLFTFYNIGDRISKVFDILHYFRDKKFVLFTIYLLSIAAQFMLIVMNYILAEALGLGSLGLGYLFLVVPVTFVFSLMPSINGLGVRDSGYVLLLTRQGLLTSEALSLSFLVTVLPMIISLAGGIIFLFYRQRGLSSPKLTEENIS